MFLVHIQNLTSHETLKKVLLAKFVKHTRYFHFRKFLTNCFTLGVPETTLQKIPCFFHWIVNLTPIRVVRKKRHTMSCPQKQKQKEKMQQ